MALKELEARYATKSAKDYKLAGGRVLTSSCGPTAPNSGG